MLVRRRGDIDIVKITAVSSIYICKESQVPVDNAPAVKKY